MGRKKKGFTSEIMSASLSELVLLFSFSVLIVLVTTTNELDASKIKKDQLNDAMIDVGQLCKKLNDNWVIKLIAQAAPSNRKNIEAEVKNLFNRVCGANDDMFSKDKFINCNALSGIELTSSSSNRSARKTLKSACGREISKDKFINCNALSDIELTSNSDNTNATKKLNNECGFDIQIIKEKPKPTTISRQSIFTCDQIKNLGLNSTKHNIEFKKTIKDKCGFDLYIGSVNRSAAKEVCFGVPRKDKDGSDSNTFDSLEAFVFLFDNELNQIKVKYVLEDSYNKYTKDAYGSIGLLFPDFEDRYKGFNEIFSKYDGLIEPILKSSDNNEKKYSFNERINSLLNSLEQYKKDNKCVLYARARKEIAGKAEVDIGLVTYKQLLNKNNFDLLANEPNKNLQLKHYLRKYIHVFDK